MKHLYLRLIVTCLFISSTLLPSQAHEGHGHTEGYSLLHYLSEPIHLAGVMTIALSAVLLFRWRSVWVKENTGKDA